MHTRPASDGGLCGDSCSESCRYDDSMYILCAASADSGRRERVEACELRWDMYSGVGLPLVNRTHRYCRPTTARVIRRPRLTSSFDHSFSRWSAIASSRSASGTAAAAAGATTLARAGAGGRGGGMGWRLRERGARVRAGAWGWARQGHGEGAWKVPSTLHQVTRFLAQTAVACGTSSGGDGGSGGGGTCLGEYLHRARTASRVETNYGGTAIPEFLGYSMLKYCPHSRAETTVAGTL